MKRLASVGLLEIKIWKLGTEPGLEGSTRDESDSGNSEAGWTAFVLVEDTLMSPEKESETLSYKNDQYLFIEGGYARKSVL